MTDSGLGRHLKLIFDISSTDSPNSSDAIGDIFVLESRGNLDRQQRRVLATIFAWAFNREEVIPLRDDLALAVDQLCDTPEVQLSALMLVSAGSGREIDPNVRSSVNEKVTAGLSGLRTDSATFMRRPDYLNFKAPYWLGVARGIARDIPAIPPLPRRRGLPRWSNHPPSLEPRFNALRERRVARATLEFLLDRQLVDDISGEVLATILEWSTSLPNDDADDAECRALLDRLRFSTRDRREGDPRARW